MTMRSPIILALDTDEVQIARQWIAATKGSINIYKVGLEFFLKNGLAGLNALCAESDFELFLDLKLHDIPNTVAGAVLSIRDVEPRFLTVHAAGGRAMVKAAVEVAPEIAITGVTVLTSLDGSSLAAMGISQGALEYAICLAKSAVEAGARALVCSPLEVSAIRAEVGPEIELITPGVRPLGSERNDQNRVMTPQEAIAAGANYLVIGRPITSFFKESPLAMGKRAEEILESLA